MRIRSSVGSVTSAFLLPAIASPSFVFLRFLLPLEVLQDGVQPPEPSRPEALVAPHPLVDGLERQGVEPIEPQPTLLTHLDRPHLPEYPEVLGHQRLAHPKQTHQVAHRALPAGGEEVEDLAPAGLGHRVESVGSSRRSSHAGIIHNYMVICQAPNGTLMPKARLAGA